MAILVPHFDLPFRLVGTSFATQEQDSTEDIANCVEAIIRTPNGSRDDSPDFGIDDLVFSNLPINIEHMRSQIESQEPRATILIKQNPDLVDQMIDTLVIQVR